MADELVTVQIDEDLLNEALARGIDIRAAFEAPLRLELKARGIAPYDEQAPPE